MTLSLLTRSMFHATRSLRHFPRIFLALVSLLATVQCALPTADNAKQTAILADMPEMSPSALSPAMACVDKRLMGNNRRQFRLTSEFIRDPSGLVAGEFYNVVAAAVGEISQRSRAFAFLDGGKEGSIERASPAERYRGRVEDKTPPPHYYFAGAITRAVSRSAYGHL